MSLLARLIVVAFGLSLFTGTPAQAEELYTLQNANGQLTDRATLVCSDDVCGPNGSFSTNPETMAQISASYGCSPGPCTFVHVDSQTRLPISSEQKAAADAAAKAAADAAIAASAKLAADAAAAAAAAAAIAAAGGTQQQADAAAAAAIEAARNNPVSGIGMVIDSISQTDIQFGICFYSLTQSRISYTNVSYSWEVKDETRILDSGSGPPAGVTLIESGACNYGNSKILNVRVFDLKPGTTYYVETRGNNAGVQFSNREAFTTQARVISTPSPIVDSSTVLSETKTATVVSETKPAAVVPEVNPVTVSETVTVIAPTAPQEVTQTQNADPVNSPETIAVIPLESDGEEVDESPVADLTAKRESSGKFLISLTSNVYEDELMVRAFKKGSKLLIFKVKTNIQGRAAIRTSRNLAGYKLAVYTGDVLLDSVKL
jgi:hypothetical protein